MHTVSSIARRIVIIGALNTAAALMFPLLLWSVGVDSDFRAFRHDFAVSLLYSQVIGIPALILFPGFWKKASRLSPFWEWIAIAVFFIGVGTAGSLLAETIELLVGRVSPARFWSRFWDVAKVCVVFTLEFGIARRIFLSLHSQLEQTTVELRDKELAEERAMNLATEARLAALESQIQPHFLFNSLNSISSLIQEDPQRAERLLERLAALLRFSLDAHQDRLVSLEKETKIVTDYLEIEQARLGERLKYDVQVPPHLLGFAVPPLSVQTLVENSIKHAIAPALAGGSVRLCIEAANDLLQVRVTDTGPGFSMDVLPAGRGLSNLQARLSHIFGHQAKLTVVRKDGTTTTQVTIPRWTNARLSG